MTASFKSSTTDELKNLIDFRERKLYFLYSSLTDLKELETQSKRICQDILNFTIYPDFDQVFKSIYSYIGIYESELKNLKEELSKRDQNASY